MMRIVDPEAAVVRAAVIMDRHPSVGSHKSEPVWKARLDAREARGADWKMDPDCGPNGYTYDPEKYRACSGCDICNGPTLSRVRAIRQAWEQRLKTLINLGGDIIWHERRRWAKPLRKRLGDKAAERVYALAQRMREYGQDPWAWWK